MPFKVQPTTLSDIPQLVDIYFASISSNTFSSAIFPDTPPVRQWWIDTLSRSLQHQKGVAMYNLLEYASGTATPVFANNETNQNNNIIAFAKWVRPMESAAATADDPPTVETPPPPTDCDQALFTRYFTELHQRHESYMGTNNPHWYLELLATHPSCSHKRRDAAAAALVNHVLGGGGDCINAGYDAYLEAGPGGLMSTTYGRLGFERRGGFVVEGRGERWEGVVMVREGGKREGEEKKETMGEGEGEGRGEQG
ncbi:gnat family [Diplodia corticola]|uniref:Gnat family n=1 Tax=Diplodia corticola TaxID=236234 RepID=A0A1J9RLP7_9PEZI|nr:gnat family [Diplodia corticola]OJD33499.1 gnat family [Diplodia corticola]